MCSSLWLMSSDLLRDFISFTKCLALMADSVWPTWERHTYIYDVAVPRIAQLLMLWRYLHTLFQISVLTTSHALLIRHLGETF